MKNIVLDADVAVAWALEGRRTEAGERIWLYAGAVEAMRTGAIRHMSRSSDLPEQDVVEQAKALMMSYAEDKQWLGVPACDDHVFQFDNPHEAMLIQALDRFPSGSVTLLTESASLLEEGDERIMSSHQYRRPTISNESPVAFIDLPAQQDAIRHDLETRIQRVLGHGQYINGPEVAELEDTLASYVGVEHCIGVSSGTDALLVAMMALGIGAGDEVITTPFTFIATGEMIAFLGATPIFADIDSKTYNIDPAAIEPLITDRTKAIVPVSLYGQCADMDAINAIGERHGIPVIEDAAQSFGAVYKGRRSCGLSPVGATSFFPSKPLGGYGDGGAVFTNDADLAKVMREIREHGQDRRYHHPRIGINGRLDALQAAILLAKTRQFEWERCERVGVANRYAAGLADLVGKKIVLPYVTEGCVSVYAQYTIQVEDREAFVAKMQEKKVPTAVHYPVPLHMQPVFASSQHPLGSLPKSEYAAEHVVSLPMHPYMSKPDQMRIIEAVRQALS